jgi:glycosyltransferase involved in cell wall biosynthesis
MHLALPAFAKLLEEFPFARFTIVGSGPHEFELRSLALTLGINHKIEWVPWLPHAKVLEMYAQNDVLLFPSLHDSSGNVVLEAMMYGLPVVCLNIGGPAAIVDSFSGIRVSAQSPEDAVEQLGSALLLLARNPTFRAFLSRGALARANNHFSWPAQIERMTSLYYTVQKPLLSRDPL